MACNRDALNQILRIILGDAKVGFAIELNYQAYS
jgi:hypothetical protein